MSCSSASPTGEIPWTEFIGFVSLYAQGVPDEVAADAIRTAAIMFARKTDALCVPIYLDAQENVDKYSFSVDDGYTVKSVKRVCVDGREYTAERKFSHCPAPCTFYFNYPCDIFLGSKPGCDGEDNIEVEAVLIPSQDSCYADRKFYDLYAEDIANGALEKLLLIPDTDWYDPSSAGLYSTKFRRSIASAKQEVARNYSTGPMYMAPVRGFFV